MVYTFDARRPQALQCCAVTTTAVPFPALASIEVTVTRAPAYKPLTLFDAALVTVSRMRRGLDPLTTPGKDHAAHRLAAAGLGQRGAIGVLYGASLALGLLALVVLRLAVLQTYLLLAGVGLLAIAAFIGLERAHGSGGNPRARRAQPDADSSRL